LFVPQPKVHIGDEGVALRGASYPIERLVAEVVRRVADEAQRQAGGPVDRVVLTHPAAWAMSRRDVLRRAAKDVGFGDIALIPEPNAAAHHIVHEHPVCTKGRCYPSGIVKPTGTQYESYLATLGEDKPSDQSARVHLVRSTGYRPRRLSI